MCVSVCGELGCLLKRKESQRAQETARGCRGKGKDADNKAEGSSDLIFPSHFHHLCSQLFHIVVKEMIQTD